MPREGGAPAITRESGDLPVAVDPLRGRGVPGGRGAFSSSERRFVRSQWCAAVASRKTRMNPPYRLFLLATAALAAPALAQETPADVVVTAAGAPQSVNETGDAITVVTRDDLEARQTRSDEHTSELQSLMRLSYA